MRTISFLTFILAIVTSSWAQSVEPTRVLQGVIINNAGTPLPDAKVYVSENKMNYQSDHQGRYHIPLPASEYTLEFSATNYLPQKISISLFKDTTINITMEALYEGIALDDVAVFGTSSDKVTDPRSGYNVLDGRTIERLPTVLGEKDVMRSIQLLPGIAASSEGSTEMNVRGGSSDQNLVMLDKVPLYSSTHLFGMFSAFNPLIVENASIYTGGFPAAHGGKISSVTDITTKTASMDSLQGSIELGFVSTKAVLQVPLIEGKASLLLAGRRTFIDLIQSFASSGEIEHFNFYDLNAVLNYRYSDKSSLKLSAYQEGDGVRLIDYGNQDREDAFGKKQQAATLIWKNFSSPKLSNEISLQYNLYRSHILENRPVMPNDHSYLHEFTSEIKDLSAHYGLVYRPWQFMDINAGLGYGSHHLKPAHFEGHDDQEPFSIYSLPNTQINELNAFAEMNLTYKGSHLSLGVRNNHFYSQPSSYHSIEPRISFAQQLGNRFSLKAAYARMSQPMQRLVNPGLGLPFDIMYPADDFIKPQFADIFSVGFNKGFKFKDSQYTFSVEGYVKEMGNILSMRDGYDTRSVILHSKAEGIYKVESIHDMLLMGTGKAIGADLLLEKKDGKVNGWISYSWMKARNQFDELNGGREFRAPEDRTHILNAVVNWEIGNSWRLSATWMFSTGRPINVPESVFLNTGPTLGGGIGADNGYLFSYGARNDHRMKPFHKLDVGMTKKLELWYLDAELNLGLYNVYNRANPSIYYIGKSFNEEDMANYPSLKSVSLFPVLPSVSLKVSF